jgi:hypothetical protein
MYETIATMNVKNGHEDKLLSVFNNTDKCLAFNESGKRISIMLIDLKQMKCIEMLCGI